MQHDNWEQHEILKFIKYKHDEHATQKALVDPRAHMIPVAQWWTKIAYDL